MKCGTIPLRFIGDSIFFKQTWFVLGEKEAKFGLYASSDLKEWHMVAANFNNYARLVEAGGRLFCYRHPYCGERSAFCDMMWSDTGFEWQPVFFDLENGFPHYVLDILFTQGQWIFLGESQRESDSFKYGCFFVTPDLQNWKCGNTSIDFPAYNSLTLAYGNNILVSTAQNSANEPFLLYLAGFSSWRKYRLPERIYDNLYFFQGKFFSFTLELSSCWFSADALSWDFYENKEQVLLSDVKASWPRMLGDDLVVRPALSGTALYFSRDFLHWRKKDLPFKMHTCAVSDGDLVLMSGRGEVLQEKTNTFFI